MESYLVNKIIATYPTAWSYFLTFYESIFNKPEPDIPTAKETIGKSELEKIVKTLLLKTNPRFLYDFFDDLRLFLFILPDEDTFKVEISAITGLQTGERFFSRKAAEEKGFFYCFQFLEDHLLSSEAVKNL